MKKRRLKLLLSEEIFGWKNSRYCQCRWVFGRMGGEGRGGNQLAQISIKLSKLENINTERRGFPAKLPNHLLRRKRVCLLIAIWNSNSNLRKIEYKGLSSRHRSITASVAYLLLQSTTTMLLHCLWIRCYPNKKFNNKYAPHNYILISKK